MSAVEHNIISVSGGKDSTALLLLAIERQPDNLQAVFADTGNEHPQTYDYVRYIERATGVPIRWVKADFARQIEGKAEYVREHWPRNLTKSAPGYWRWGGSEDEEPDTYPGPPGNACLSHKITYPGGTLEWVPEVVGMSQAEAQAIVERAVAALKPTGNPFLDLCAWKGRFPSTKARFCSEELKRNPIIEQVQMPLMDAGDRVVSWQGVRADESARRAELPELDCASRDAETGGELWNYRPILKWSAADAFAMHRKHGVKHNPLYEQGMGRVGCMPCIHCRKDELLEISRRFPDEIKRIAQWDAAVGAASKRQASTFFAAADRVRDSIAVQGLTGQQVTDIAGVWSAVEWSRTGKGGRNFDLFRGGDETPACSSAYGLCE